MECGWANPEMLSKMYLDNFDLFGLFWWADKIKEQNEKIKGK